MSSRHFWLPETTLETSKEVETTLETSEEVQTTLETSEEAETTLETSEEAETTLETSDYTLPLNGGGGLARELLPSRMDLTADNED